MDAGQLWFIRHVVITSIFNYYEYSPCTETVKTGKISLSGGMSYMDFCLISRINAKFFLLVISAIRSIIKNSEPSKWMFPYGGIFLPSLVRYLCWLVRYLCWLVRSLCWLVRSICWLVTYSLRRKVSLKTCTFPVNAMHITTLLSDKST